MSDPVWLILGYMAYGIAAGAVLFCIALDFYRAGKQRGFNKAFNAIPCCHRDNKKLCHDCEDGDLFDCSTESCPALNKED